jgi:hypothetical protein
VEVFDWVEPVSPRKLLTTKSFKNMPPLTSVRQLCKTVNS